MDQNYNLISHLFY